MFGAFQVKGEIHKLISVGKLVCRIGSAKPGARFQSKNETRHSVRTLPDLATGIEKRLPAWFFVQLGVLLKGAAKENNFAQKT